jgi:hypothetical protein
VLDGCAFPACFHYDNGSGAGHSSPRAHTPPAALLSTNGRQGRSSAGGTAHRSGAWASCGAVIAESDVRSLLSRSTVAPAEHGSGQRPAEASTGSTRDGGAGAAQSPCATLRLYDLLLARLSRPHERECPTCGHAQVGSAAEPALICARCGTSYCFHHSAAHGPATPCDAYEASQARAWAADTAIVRATCRACPGCGLSAAKDEGCNHVRCIRCAASWCWLCGRAVADVSWPDHYAWWAVVDGCPNKQMTGETPGPFSDHLVLNLLYGAALVLLSPLWLLVGGLSFLGYLAAAGCCSRSGKRCTTRSMRGAQALSPLARAASSARSVGASGQTVAASATGGLSPSVLLFFGFVALPLFLLLLPLYCLLAFVVVPGMIRAAATAGVASVAAAAMVAPAGASGSANGESAMTAPALCTTTGSAPLRPASAQL